MKRLRFALSAPVLVVGRIVVHGPPARVVALRRPPTGRPAPLVADGVVHLRRDAGARVFVVSLGEVVVDVFQQDRVVGDLGDVDLGEGKDDQGDEPGDEEDAGRRP